MNIIYYFLFIIFLNYYFYKTESITYKYYINIINYINTNIQQYIKFHIYKIINDESMNNKIDIMIKEKVNILQAEIENKMKDESMNNKIDIMIKEKVNILQAEIENKINNYKDYNNLKSLLNDNNKIILQKYFTNIMCETLNEHNLEHKCNIFVNKILNNEESTKILQDKIINILSTDEFANGLGTSMKNVSKNALTSMFSF